MLLALLQVYTDAMAAGELGEAAKFWDIIRTQYGSSKDVQWLDKEDDLTTKLGGTKVEVEAAKEIKDIYASLGRENDGITNSGTSKCGTAPTITVSNANSSNG